MEPRVDQNVIADAPGWPGIQPRWTSSDKTGVGTALSPLSRVWFTISHGILNEVYYPRVDKACTRDLGLIVTDGLPGGFFAEEKRDTDSRIETLADGVPAYRVVNTCRQGRFTIEKCVIADPRHDVVLQHVIFTDHYGAKEPKLRLFALLSPHLVNGGAHNTGWLDDYKGDGMLLAEGDGTALALSCQIGWAARSAGFVAVSDGWQVLRRDGRLAEQYQRAANGNVALCGEIDLRHGQEFMLSLGFGTSWSEAAWRARAAMQRPFRRAQLEYCDAWRHWQAGLRPLRGASATHDTYRISTAVLRTHDSPAFSGGIIASLSIPWGFSKGDDDLGGYHLVWPRDLVETAGALLAAGANTDALRVLDYLRSIQEPAGGWPQNCWLDGIPYWKGLQLDECAFPILLLDMCRRHGAVAGADVGAYWPMVRAAAGFVLRTGPVTGQDRWEEDGGYSPFTLGVIIAALLVAADYADQAGEPALGTLCRDTADAWCASIEAWCFAPGSAPAAAAGAIGHYVRIAPAVDGTAAADVRGVVQIRNRDQAHTDMPADAVVSPDALALVRFGLRAADDPHIEATVATIDHLLRRELPAGPCWYRYNADGYGEHEDGSPFDGTGIGRLWPLMTGERAHYELAAGRPAEARRLLATMEGLTSDGFLIPEQVWDGDDVPAHELKLGRPSGSAMPLVWAHGEHIKLCRSLADGAVFDTPPQTVARYASGQPVTPRVQPWRPDWRAGTLAAGRVLRLDLPAPAEVTWSADGWATQAKVATTDSGVGLHVAELPTGRLPAGSRVAFRAGGIEGVVEVG
jgi:glucoamylase